MAVKSSFFAFTALDFFRNSWSKGNMAQSSPPTETTVESKDIGVIESSELGIYTTPRRTTMEKVKL